VAIASLVLQMFLLGATPALADADTDFHPPSAVIQNTGWESPNNVYTSDNNRAKADNKNDVIQYGNFNFGIPDGATINGIEVKIEGYRNATDLFDGDRQADISLSGDAGSVWSGFKTTELPYSVLGITGEGTKYYGSSVDKWAKASWNYSEFSNDNFRLKLDATSALLNLYIDYVAAKVYYTENVAPTIPTLVSPPNTGILNYNNPYLSWNASADTEGYPINYVLEIGTASDFSLTPTLLKNTTELGYQILSGEVLPDGIYYWRVKANDGFADSAWSDSRSFTVDTTHPTADFTYLPSSWTNGNVTATIVPSETITITNNSSLTTKVFSANSSFTFEFYDLAGNTGSATANVTWIDKVAPTSSAYGVPDYSNNYLVTIPYNSSDNLSGVSSVSLYYRYNLGSWKKYATDFTSSPIIFDSNSADENGYYDFYTVATDNAGNIETQPTKWYGKVVEESVYVDNIYPVVKQAQVNADYIPFVNGHSFDISAEVRDINSSGINTSSCKYTLDGTNWYAANYLLGTCYKNNLTASNGQVLSISFRVADKAGNISEGVPVTRTADIDHPTGTTLIDNAYYGPNTDYDGFIKGTASDGTSGVKKVELKIKSSDNKYWNGSSWSSPQWWWFGWYPTVTAVGTTDWNYSILESNFTDGITYTVTPMEISDNVSNKSIGGADSFTWDSTEPIVSGAPSPTGLIGINNPVIRLGFTDTSGSGFQTNLGSNEQLINKVTYKIDDVEVIADPSCITISGLNNSLLDFNCTTSTLDLSDGLHKVELQVRDIAGNLSVPTEWDFTIDTTNPTGAIAYNTIAPTNKDVIATLTTDDNIGPVTITNNFGLSTYVFEDNGTFTFEFEDAAGNKGTAVATVTNIDLVAPVITLNGVTPNITVGGTYTELGATADDGSVVTPTGSVNTAVVGNYIITYNAADTAGNVGSPVTRTVNVVAAPVLATTFVTGTEVPEVAGVSTTPTPTPSVTPTVKPTEETPEVKGETRAVTDDTDWWGVQVLGVSRWVWGWLLFLALALAGYWWFILGKKRKAENK